MELNKEELIELGFEPTDALSWKLRIGFFQIETDAGGVIIYLQGQWHDTNAETIQDIKDLIRLFK